jgi:hypothetical protein
MKQRDETMEQPEIHPANSYQVIRAGDNLPSAGRAYAVDR